MRKFPIVGFFVGVVNPFARAVQRVGGFQALTGGNEATLRDFANALGTNYTGYDAIAGKFEAVALAQTYVPIGIYVIIKKAFGRTLSRLFQGLPISF